MSLLLISLACQPWRRRKEGQDGGGGGGWRGTSLSPATILLPGEEEKPCLSLSLPLTARTRTHALPAPQ